MIRDATGKLLLRQNLTREETRAALLEILQGKASPTLIAAFATALRAKGETVDEIVGAAQAMREHMIRVKVDAPVVVDTCGTGGDGKGTFNVSTIAAFVVSGAGVTVAKHGNRAASSKCGSADLLEALGVAVDASQERVERCLNEIGIGFLMAPLYHPALRYAAPVRKELGFRTIFNLLGPLCNPAGANCQTVGVSAREFVDPMARTLRDLGTRHSLAFHSADGMDELSISADNYLCETNGTGVHASTLPARSRAHVSIAGGTPQENARIALSILKGEPGPCRDTVLLNSGACLMIAGKVPTIDQGVAEAGESIDSGRALDKLNRLTELTRG